MKFLLNIKLVLFTLIGMVANAQNDFPKDGDNFRNSNLDKFVGTWVWKNGNDEFVFILKKENILLPIGENIRADALYGFHKYIKNGQEIENSTQYKQTNYEDKKHTFLSFGRGKSSELNIGIFHLSKNKNVNGYIEYLDFNRIKLVKLENLQGIRILKPGEKSDSSISLPQDIILIRQ